MKGIIIFTLQLLTHSIFGQTESFKTNQTEVIRILDSIKQKTLTDLPFYGTDTTKTARSPRICSPTNLQSPMFIINSPNGQFIYKFYQPSDSINIEQFFKEYSKIELIDKVVILKALDAQILYGVQGTCGVVNITLKKRAALIQKLLDLKLSQKNIKNILEII